MTNLEGNLPLEQPAESDGFLFKAILLVTSTLTVMAGAIISPSLPAIQNYFIDTPDIEFWARLVLTLPALFIVIGAPIVGYIVDKMGRKRLLIVAAVLYAVAGGSGYLASSIWMLLISRAFLGLGVAGVMTSVTTLITDYYTGRARSTFLGLQAAFMGLGGTLFLPIGGVLADINWRAPFLLYLSSLLIIPFIIRILYEPARHTPENLQSAAGGVNRVPLRLMVFVYANAAFMQIVFYTVPVQLPFYLQGLVGATGAATGIAIALATLFFALASSQFSRFEPYLDHIPAVMLAFVMTGVAFVGLGLAEGWALLLVALPLAGFGIGLMMPSINVWLANESPVAIRGRAMGGFTTAIFFGQFLSPIVTQPLIQPLEIDGMYVAIGLLLVVLSGGLLVGRRVVERWIQA